MRWEAAGGHFLIAMKIFQMGNRKSKKTPPEPSAPYLSSDNEGRGLSEFGSLKVTFELYIRIHAVFFK